MLDSPSVAGINSKIKGRIRNTMAFAQLHKSAQAGSGAIRVSNLNKVLYPRRRHHQAQLIELLFQDRADDPGRM